MSYGHQGLKEKADASRIQEVSSLKQDKFKVTVSLDKERPMSKSSPLRQIRHPKIRFAPKLQLRALGRHDSEKHA